MLSQSTVTADGFGGHEIPRRDLRFAVEDADFRSWHPLGPHVAHFFNVLSLLFPEGETFFIDSVRHYADRIHSPQLAREVAGFLAQEAMHSREHRRYNRGLAKAGLPAAELEAELVVLLDWVRAIFGPAERLGATIALEHFTAIMADLALAEDGILEGADPRLGALWRWHAVEETEHKAVAFDVFAEAVGSGPLGYTRRSVSMLIAAAIFWTVVLTNHLRLVAADRALLDWRGWWGYARFLLGSPGLLRRTALPWLGYFRFGFHPWQHDNFDRVRDWKSSIAGEAKLPA